MIIIYKKGSGHILYLSFAIIIGVILAIAGILANNYYDGKLPLWIILVISGLIIISGAAQYLYETEKEKKESYTGLLTGELSDNVEFPKLKFGTSAGLIWEGEVGEPILEIAGNPLYIWIENGELKLSTLIRNEDGEIIAKISANEWILNKNNIFDRNYDENGLEVINSNDEVVLQADFDGDGVQFAGIFNQKDGWRYYIGNNKIGQVAPGDALDFELDRIFRYPSDLHFGERV